MKRMLFVIASLLLVSNFLVAQQVSTETNLQYDQNVGGVSLQRIDVRESGYGVKYDRKIDLKDNEKVNDVLGVFIPSLVNNDKVNLSLCFIKLGDWTKEDEGFADITLNYKGKNFAYKLNVGQGVNSQSGPRSYAVTRLSHSVFTIEAGFLTKHNYRFKNTLDNKYYWGAIHPQYIYLAAGSEPDNDWAFVGTKDMKKFGNFSFVKRSHGNNDFWFRTQFAAGDVNENFYCLDNYLFSTSYLVISPFFETHFGPISTKGTYGFKIDGKRTGNLEKYEVVGARQFGSLGQVALGWEKEIPNKNGLILEYYNQVKISGLNLSVELKYESLYSRLSGFVTTKVLF